MVYEREAELATQIVLAAINSGQLKLNFGAGDVADFYKVVHAQIRASDTPIKQEPVQSSVATTSDTNDIPF